MVTLEEIQEMSVRAFESGQERLAGCLFMVADAQENMTLGELFDLLKYYRKGEIKMELIPD